MQFVAREISVGVSIGMRHISLAHCVMSTSVYVRVVTAGKSTIISMTILPRLSPFLPHSHLVYLHFTIVHVHCTYVIIFSTHPHCSHAHTKPHFSQSIYMQLPITFCCLFAMFACVFQEKKEKKGVVLITYLYHVFHTLCLLF